MDLKHNAVYRFLTQDVKSESETKELAVLIRYLDFLFGVYFIFVATYVAFLGYYTFSLVLIFAIGILTGSFICTYENKTQTGLVLFNMVVISTNSYMTLVIGYNRNYHWLMFITIFLVYFNLRKSQRYKMFYAVFLSIFILIITIISVKNPVIRPDNTELSLAIIIANLITFSLSIVLSAYFFCAKFMQSEEKIMQYNKKLIKMASVDALTGLYNRRHMNDYLKELTFSAAKANHAFCVAIGDVDLFKNINDTYGHDTGDYVLVTISNMFLQFIEGRGAVSRWGGEEFLFVFDTEHINICYADLEQLRKKIDNYEFHFREHIFHVSMTFGIEEYDEHLGIETTITRADSKLYKGKKEGRNQVVR